MAKFYGAIGFIQAPMETKPGVWEEIMAEREYYGDILRNTRQARDGEKINNDLSVNNSISIVADAYANEHFFAMRYAKWAGALWSIEDIEVQSPRLILRLGGVYNGPTPPAAPASGEDGG